MRRPWVLVLSFLAAVAWAEPAFAEEAPPPPPLPASAVVVAPAPVCDPCGPWWAPKRLSGEVLLGSWLSKMDGTLGVRGREAEVNQDWDDVFDLLEDHLDGILQGSARLSYGRWTLSFTGSLLRLQEPDAVFPQGTGRAEAEIFQGQLNLWYRLGAAPLGCEPCTPWILYDAYVGVRMLSVDAEITAPVARFTDSRDWVDPVVGGRIALDFNRRWVVDLQADIGGFGVSSDLTWMVRTGVEWWPARWFGVKAGYLWLSTDYEDGSGADRFVWDVLQDGPYLGLAFRF